MTVSKVLGPLFAGAIGAAIAFAIFDPGILLGSAQYWNQISGDNSASLIGYYALAHDAWRWPVLQTELINYPAGGNIYYTDSVPLMALIGKLIFKETGILYPYFGLWIFLSYILMGLFGYLVFRILKLNTVAALAGSTLLILLPEFIWRHVHIGLIGQFVIVAFIYAYIRLTSISGRTEVVILAAVLPLVIAINAYLFVMCAALFVAGVLDAWRIERMPLKAVLLALTTTVFVSVFVAAAFGLVGQGISLPVTEGFGQFAMNLASPIWPQYSLLSFGKGFLDPIGGHYEGFNYLGLGALALIALSAALQPGAYRRLIGRRPFLACVLVGLLIYAASSKIYFGPYKILDINYASLPILDRITSTFRSSGRFFWPVGFVLVVCAVVILYRRLGPRYATPLLIGAVMVQAIDIRPMFRLTYANTVRDTQRLPADPELTTDLIGSRSVLLFVPGALCGINQELEMTLQVQHMAAWAGRPFDGAYLNRGGMTCGELAASFAADPFRGLSNPRALLVALKSSVGPSAIAYGMGEDVRCREGRYAYFCARAPLDAKLAAFGRDLAAPAPLPLGVDLNPSGDGAAFLGTGWSVRYPVFRWAEGPVTTFFGRLPKEACKEVRFSAEIVPFGFKGYAVDTAELSVRGGGSAKLDLDRMGQQRIDLSLPLERCVDHIDLSVTFKDPKSPEELGMNTDPRRVTWGFFNYRIDAR